MQKPFKALQGGPPGRLSVCLSGSISPTIYLSVRPSSQLSINISVCLPVSLSDCLYPCVSLLPSSVCLQGLYFGLSVCLRSLAVCPSISLPVRRYVILCCCSSSLCLNQPSERLLPTAVLLETACPPLHTYIYIYKPHSFQNTLKADSIEMMVIISMLR